MDFNLLGTMLDPANCSKLSMEEKRNLVYELSKHPQGNPEMLMSWSRHEILQLLCVEMGKERKYTGLTKIKIIENLLKIVSEKNSRETGVIVSEHPLLDSSGNKSQRKSDQISPFPTPANSASGSNGIISTVRSCIQCKNSACKASLNPEDMFCKRCSCCICQKFDDNKDPSLWLTCSSEPPFEGDSCNMSCHLECALKHERSGLSERGQVAQLDGSFYCVSCGKMNDLLKCWRKQLTIARDTRRVDILCYRVFLSQKLLNGTNKYQKLSEIVDRAVNKLQAEVGPLTDMTAKMGRGIVNRMSAGHEIQRLCTSAVELLDSLLSEATAHPQTSTDQDSGMSVASNIRFEDVSETSAAVILGPTHQVSDLSARYTMWHRKAADEKDPSEPTSTLSPPGTRIVVHGLVPSTEYIFKVVSFNTFQEPTTYEARLSTTGPATKTNLGATVERSQSPITNCSTLSNPSSVEDETNNITSDLNENDKAEEKDAPNNTKPDEANGSNKPKTTGLEIVPCPLPPPPEKCVPITPCRTNALQTIGWNGKSKPRRLSKKRNRESQEEEDGCDGNEDLEFYVKVIRRLECEGHLEKSFRQKFLTWFSLRATPQEIHVVQVFVNTFRGDPGSLAEQLIDAFDEIVSSKRSEAGFCMKLWH